MRYGTNAMHTRLDQAMKRLVRDLVATCGTFTPDMEVSPDPQDVDGYFVPNPQQVSPIASTLLGRITSAPCSLEFFSSTPDMAEVTACARKHLNLLHVLASKDADAVVPHQWIISAGKPKLAMANAWARHAQDWPRGVYATPPMLGTSIVVVNQLPETRATLLLRLMGRGRTLRRAVAELKALPDDDFERCTVLPILVRFRVEAAQEPVPTDEEFLMTTQEIVKMFEREAELRGEKRGEKRGERRGRLQAKRDVILRMLHRKFGALPDPVTARVQEANVHTLDRFADKLLFANTIDEVMADEQ